MPCNRTKTATQPQRCSSSHGNLCWLSVQLLGEWDWCGLLAVGSMAECTAYRGRYAWRASTYPRQPLRIEMGPERNEKSVAGG